MSTTLDTPVMEQITANFRGNVRTETLNGRKYLVAPLTMIVEGVLNGSRGPLYYPREEIAKDPSIWNNIPIVVHHPEEDGQPVSARHPRVLERQGIGHVFNAQYKNKLVAEGWFDIEKTKAVDPSILQNLRQHRPMELSTGLFTDNYPARGTFNGRHYDYIARGYRADHLAILPGKRGACSVEDGCGVLINAFCPTGEGGGQDNSCAPSRAAMRATEQTAGNKPKAAAKALKLAKAGKNKAAAEAHAKAAMEHTQLSAGSHPLYAKEHRKAAQLHMRASRKLSKTTSNSPAEKAVEQAKQAGVRLTPASKKAMATSSKADKTGKAADHLRAMAAHTAVRRRTGNEYLWDMHNDLADYHAKAARSKSKTFARKTLRQDREIGPANNEATMKKSIWTKLGEALGIVDNADGDNCGTGAGGFQPGNKCAAGDGSGGGSGGAGKGKKYPRATDKVERQVQEYFEEQAARKANKLAKKSGRARPYAKDEYEKAQIAMARSAGVSEEELLKDYPPPKSASKKSGGGRIKLAGMSKVASAVKSGVIKKGSKLTLTDKYGDTYTGTVHDIVGAEINLTTAKTKTQRGGNTHRFGFRGHADAPKIRSVIIHNQQDDHGGSSTNNEGDATMARLNEVQRAELVGQLTANCECEKTKKEQEEKLGKLSDETLQDLAKNECAVMPAGKKKVKKTEDEPVGNAGKDIKAWLKDAPPEVRSIVINQLKRDRKVKASLIEKITANKANIFTKEQLEGMTTEQLEPIAALAANQSREDDELDELLAPNNYLGAAAPMVANRLSEAEELDQDDVLPLPTVNWAKVAEEDRVAGQRKQA